MRRGDGLRHETDLAEAGQLGRSAKTRCRALFGSLVADESDGPPEGDRRWGFTGELVRAVPNVDQDERDQLFEAFGIAEHVCPRLERIAQKRLERLEEAPGRVHVGVDVGLDDRVIRIGRRHEDPERLELSGERPARPIVLEVRIDGRPPDDRGPVSLDVQDGRHSLANERIDGKYTGRRAVAYRERSVGRAEIKAEPHGPTTLGRAAGLPTEGPRAVVNRPEAGGSAAA